VAGSGATVTIAKRDSHREPERDYRRTASRRPGRSNAYSIAERLIALFPVGAGSRRPPQNSTAGAVPAIQPDIIKYIIAMMLILGPLSLAENHRQSELVRGAKAPIASVIVPPTGPSR
jgi:hypothetical protein